MTQKTAGPLTGPARLLEPGPPAPPARATLNGPQSGCSRRRIRAATAAAAERRVRGGMADRPPTCGARLGRITRRKETGPAGARQH